MEILQSLVLGIVQGITEFLPISSSGHLILIPAIFGWEQRGLAFDTVLHLGTALALIIYFRKDIIDIVTKDRELGYKILLGSIPAGILGFFLDGYFESYFRGGRSVAFLLILGSLLMLFAELTTKPPVKVELTYKKSFLIGLFQSLALFPGVSRSGATISGGLLLGIRHRDAARFSFLLSIPIVLGAGLYKILTMGVLTDPLTLGVGFITSLLSGLLAIKFMMFFLRTNRLYLFITYRLLMAFFILSFIL